MNKENQGHLDDEGNTWVKRDGKWAVYLKQPLTGITECCEEPNGLVGASCGNCFGIVQPDKNRNSKLNSQL